MKKISLLLSLALVVAHCGLFAQDDKEKNKKYEFVKTKAGE